MLLFQISCLTTLTALSGALVAAETVTYSKDVAPILQERCQGCHHPGDIAPMSLLTYKETRPWAKAIRNVVVLRKMPPWSADPKIGHFANDRSLSKRELDTITAWVDQGAPEGNPADAPIAKTFSKDWKIGKPDAVVEIPVAFDVPASGTIAYQYIVVPTGFTEDKWVTAVEIRPSNPAVVHHIIASQREPGPTGARLRRGVYTENLFGLAGPEGAAPRPRAPRSAAEPPMFSNADLLEVFVPGGRPPVLKPGQARLVKAGSDVLFQIHYTTTGKLEKDRTQIAFQFSSEPPKEQVRAGLVFNQRFAIPPGASSYLVEAQALIKRDVKLLSMLPHMHLRGKDFEFRATYPSGESEVLLQVSHYDFHWQTNYYLAEPKPLPAGTILSCRAHYDNSANNPDNPNPNAAVNYGPQTWDEMLNGFFEVIVDPAQGSGEIVGSVKVTGKVGE